MSKKYRKHGYAERLKYMHMLENGFSRNYIERRFGISGSFLDIYGHDTVQKVQRDCWKKQNVRADYAFKLEVVRDVEENNITLLDASLKYNASASQIKVWLKVARTQGYDALAITRPRGRPPKNAMGRSRKKKPEEMTELERLRYENECLRAENALLKK